MKPHYQDDAVTLFHGDCLEVMRTLPDSSVDSVVCDPPYGLANTTSSQVIETLAAWLAGDREYLPGGSGFMGKSWDAFVPPVAVWDEALRVLKPGGHLLAFAGSRTFDLMALGVRLAGFEVRDSIAWLYGSGFPKSLDVSKAIDARANVNEETKRRIALVAEVIRTHREAKGMERAEVSRAVVGSPSGACWNWEHHQLPSAEMWPAIKRTLDIPDKFDGLIEGTREMFIGAEREVIQERTMTQGGGTSLQLRMGEAREVRADITAPATPDAARWQGWGTALKPAFEPIVVARKPLAGTVAANVLAHGTGALNIDGCRVDGGERPLIEADYKATENSAYAGRMNGSLQGGSRNVGTTSTGRWPTNVVLDESQAAELDRQSGTTVSRVGKPRGAAHGDGWGMTATGAEYDDQGGASRFFPTFRYEAKAPTEERPRYTRPMLRLRGDLTPAQVDHVRARLAEAGVQVD